MLPAYVTEDTSITQINTSQNTRNDLETTKESIDHSFIEGFDTISPLHNTSSPDLQRRMMVSAQGEYEERFRKNKKSVVNKKVRYGN